MTSFSDIYILFYDKIEKDKDFFSYNNVSEDEAMEIAQTRANTLLIEATNLIMLKCTPDIDFCDYNLENEMFIENLTPIEKGLLSEIMYMLYIKRDFVKLKAFKTHLSVDGINLYSPANERKTFTDMYNDLKRYVYDLIGNYSMRDRNTGKLKGIDFALYDDADED